MAMHDWKPVEPNLYHHFHQFWAMAISTRLNAGLLPRGYSALVEQHAAGLVPDVLAVERLPKPRGPSPVVVGTALAEPKTRLKVQTVEQVLSQRANRVAIRHGLGEVVCIIEIVSPGNKAGQRAITAFVDKTVEFLNAGVNILLVDPFPPTPRDPHSLHKLIWDAYTLTEAEFDLPEDEPLLMASYRAGEFLSGRSPVAYLEPFQVGATLLEMPAWLDSEFYVNVPLEAAYQTAWENCPADMRYVVEHGHLPEL